jgi:hypothetical protein
MKHLIFMGLFLISSINILSAQKCKPLFVEEDDFTEQTKEYYGNIIGRSSMLEGVTSSITACVLKEGDNKKLYIRYSAIMSPEEYKTSQNSWLGKVEESTNKVFFSTDKKPLKFAVSDTRLKVKELLGKYSMNVELTCELSDEAYQAFCKSLTKKVRVEMGNRQFDYKISKKKAEKFKKRATCAQ